MRTRTTAQRNRLSAARPNHYVKVEVENADRTYKDLTNLQSVDWVDAVQWGETVDSPTGTATISLRRDTSTPSSLSLAPTIGGSPLNRNNAGAYAPLLDTGRNLRISTAVTDPGVAPVTGDWKIMFVGRIDSVRWNADPVDVQCRDLGGWVADAFIQSKLAYATSAPTAVETVMAQILAAWPVFGAPSLYTPASPGWMINNTAGALQERKSVLEALQQDWALKIGGVCRYRFDASDNYRLTFYLPDRAKTTPDDTFGPTEYRDVTSLEISDTDVRNKIVGTFFDADGVQHTRTVQNSGSQTKYGVRFMEIALAAGDPIDSDAEMDTLLAAAASDLGSPFATQEIETLYYWPAQLDDLYLFSSNGAHYDSDQKLAVVGYTHRFANGEGVTTLQCSGNVKGVFRAWFRTGPTSTTAPLAMRVVRTAANGLQVTVLVYVADPAPEAGAPILITAEGDGVGSVMPNTDQLEVPTDVITRDLLTTASREFVITRPEPDAPQGRVSFRAERDNRLPAVQSVDVLARGAYTLPSPVFGPAEHEGTAEDNLAEGAVHLPILFEPMTREILIYATEGADNPPTPPDLDESSLAHRVLRHEGSIASDLNWQTEVDLSTTTGFYRRLIAIPIGPTGLRGDSFTIEALQCVDSAFSPLAPPSAFGVTMSVVAGKARASLAWTTGDALASTRVWRNGIVLTRAAPGVVTLLDDDLSPNVSYNYKVQHIYAGTTTAYANAGTLLSDTPQLVAPTWAVGYPRNGGFDSTLIIPPANGIVLLRVVNPDPDAATDVWMNDQQTLGGTYNIVETIPAGQTDLALNAADAPGSPTNEFRFFYLVATRPGYTDSVASAIDSAKFAD